MLVNGNDQSNDFNSLLQKEWLETNGLGGYASGTVSGAHSRRYHGLLVAAMHPPVGRLVVVSKLDETIVVGDKLIELGSNQYTGAVHPQGFKYLSEFKRDLFPEFYIRAEGIEIRKTIAAVHGENTTLVLYEVIEAPKTFSLEFLPLYSCRDFHGTTHANQHIGQSYLFDEGIFQTKNYHDCPEFFILVPNSNFIENKCWYYNFEFPVEQYRGLDFKEDLYTHGKFLVKLKKGDKLGVILSTEEVKGKNAFSIFEKEKDRRLSLVKDFSSHKNLKRLALASDQFIVKRGDLKTVIAGYHWFSDWGRDTMIALPGLCLATKRFDDARNILQAFAESVSNGMLPNRFPDYGEAPEYNSVDATLWFFQAIYQYYKHTTDKEFIKKLVPVLEDIVAWHYKGTRYSIHVDPSDELLYAGEPGVQLTWMDARVGDWVVTPRIGKPVEINALWYNVLRIMNYLFSELDGTEEKNYLGKSRRVLESFNTQFWNEHQGCLYDFVNGAERNDDLRPNQIYAVSLPFPLLEKDKAQKVLKIVTERLLTRKGLRSLSQDNKAYHPVYGGDQRHRDNAYHQGTVWSFLLGPYIDALINVNGAKGKSEAIDILNRFFKHMDEACIGSVSEIFDAEPPHTARGCVAQAWGVAEVLRVSVEHKLFA